MANWFCSVFSVMCRKRLSSPRCRSELIDSAWVVIVPGQNCINRKKRNVMYVCNVSNIMYAMDAMQYMQFNM